MHLNRAWEESIFTNFAKASKDYNANATIQKYFALRLAQECAKQSIPHGLWADLGSGTGLLAEALESFHPNQTVLRIDGSKGMLAQQPQCKQSILWDLNLGLPEWEEDPKLIASSFALHWLLKPVQRLQEWIKALDKSGWLALAVPIDGCFPEWQLAAKKANVSFTSLQLPSQSSLFKCIPTTKLHYGEIHKFTQEESIPLSLLKPIIQVGAQATHKQKLTTGELRKLIKAWPRSHEKEKVKLTWFVQMLLVQT